MLISKEECAAIIVRTEPHALKNVDVDVLINLINTSAMLGYSKSVQPQQRDSSATHLKPLTDEQLDTIANSFSTWMFPVETQRRDCDRAIARAIKAAHGIKE